MHVVNGVVYGVVVAASPSHRVVNVSEQTSGPENPLGKEDTIYLG